MSFWQKRGACVVLVVISVLATVVCVSAYNAASWCLMAERAYLANVFVLELLTEYVSANKGAWPASWEDLEKLPGPERAMFRWPEDKDEIQRYVSIDFAVDPQKLAQQSVDQFAAVQPRGPCYPYDAKIGALLEAVRLSK